MALLGRALLRDLTFIRLLTNIGIQLRRLTKNATATKGNYVSCEDVTRTVLLQVIIIIKPRNILAGDGLSVGVLIQMFELEKLKTVLDLEVQ